MSIVFRKFSTKEDFMTLLEQIKRLCNKNAIPLRVLEKELKLGNGSLSKWDKSAPSVEKVQRVAGYFNVSVDYLLTGDEKQAVNQHQNKTYYTSQELFNLFGFFVKQKRISHGETQKDLAQFLKVEPYMIDDWEHGRGKINPFNYTKICRKYNIITRRELYYFIDEAFGSQLTQSRQNARYTLEIISNHLGYDAETVEKWERGNYILDEHNCKSLCNYYALDLPHGFSFPNSSTYFYEEDYARERILEDINDIYKALNNDGLKKILSYATDIKSSRQYSHPESKNRLRL